MGMVGDKGIEKNNKASPHTTHAHTRVVRPHASLQNHVQVNDDLIPLAQRRDPRPCPR